MGRVSDILKGGFARASGSRSSISDVATSYGSTMSRWTLDLQRWRTSHWHLLRQQGKFSHFVRLIAKVVSSKGDSAEFRVWSQRGQISTDDVFTRCVTAYGANGVRMALSPTFKMLERKSYHGIVASVDLRAILDIGFATNREDARITVFCFDNHKADRVALRHLTALLRTEPNIFVC